MENIFSSNGQETIDKAVELETETVENAIKNVNSYFECESVVNWINSNESYKRIALQFPDDLLKYSAHVTLELQDKCKNALIFVLGDTSYGSCCVDIVAGQHYDADAIVHYGHTCLSKTTSIPVYYVFDKYDLNFEQLSTELEELTKKQNENIIILYDLSYYHLYDSLKKLGNERIFVSDVDLNDNQYITNRTSPNQSDDILIQLHSRLLPKVPLHAPVLFYYIGSNEKFLNLFQLYFNQMKFVRFNQKTNVEQTMKRLLMKRYYLIEKARDAQIFGILIGTMAVAHYKEAMEHATSIIKRAKRKYYTFLIGKINCAKLNNFMEVDLYVLIACNENSLIDSKELNKPCITLYELEIAFNCARTWGNEFICDYNELLPGMKHYVPLELSSNETDVSLVTGGLRTLNVDENDQAQIRNEIIKRDDGLSVLHYSGAGEHLKNRSWTGLEQKLGETPVVKAVEGRKGIASYYENEPE